MIRIAVTGPESTGKSEMSKRLAEHFGGVYVAEFAREYLETHGPNYERETVELIAWRQNELLNQSFPEHIKLVVFDTDLLVCQIWMEHVFGACPAWIQKAASTDSFDLTLLMQVDLPWEDDPLREHPRERETLFTKYQIALLKSGRKFECVEGIGEARFESAISKISKHIQLNSEHNG
jgi:nicotinamide riboside kinase